MENEAKIIAELYHQLRCAGMDADLEVTTRSGRLDMVVCGIAPDHYMAIVEGKGPGLRMGPGQRARYLSIGLPVHEINDLALVPALVARLADALKDAHHEVSFDDLTDLGRASIPTRSRARKEAHESTFSNLRARSIINGLNFRQDRTW